MHLLLIVVCSRKHSCACKVFLRPRPKPLDWIELATVRRVEQQTYVVFLSCDLYFMCIVEIEIVKKQCAPFMIGVLANFVEKVNERESVYRLLNSVTSHNVSVYVSACSYCYRLEGKLLLFYNDRRSSERIPCTQFDLVRWKHCFVHKVYPPSWVSCNCKNFFESFFATPGLVLLLLWRIC